MPRSTDKFLHGWLKIPLCFESTISPGASLHLSRCSWSHKLSSAGRRKDMRNSPAAHQPWNPPTLWRQPRHARTLPWNIPTKLRLQRASSRTSSSASKGHPPNHTCPSPAQPAHLTIPFRTADCSPSAHMDSMRTHGPRAQFHCSRRKLALFNTSLPIDDLLIINHPSMTQTTHRSRVK